MDRFFNILIEIIYWILIFLSPLLGFSIIAVIVYLSNPANYWLSILLIIIGAILGVVFAERVRLKYGTSTFMGRIRGNSEFIEEQPISTNKVITPELTKEQKASFETKFRELARNEDAKKAIEGWGDIIVWDKNNPFIPGFNEDKLHGKLTEDYNALMNQLSNGTI